MKQVVLEFSCIEYLPTYSFPEDRKTSIGLAKRTIQSELNLDTEE